jgi:hypothetical protein
MAFPQGLEAIEGARQKPKTFTLLELLPKLLNSVT